MVSRNFVDSHRAHLPMSLENLTFGDKFNQSLKGVTFPSSLQRLTFGHHFNHSLEGVIFSSSLESLTFGNRFNKSLKGVTFPRTISMLDLGLSDIVSTKAWKEWPFQVVLKAWPLAVISITASKLWFGYGFAKTGRVALPSGVRSFSCGGVFVSSLW